ncbi:MAG: hypothetical protein ACPGGK_04550 [Pikeienuella sp.]
MVTYDENSAKLARSARRKPGNEASLVWSLGGGVITLSVYALWFKFPALSVPFKMNLPGFSVTCGLALGALLAAVYYRIARRVVGQAQAAYAEVLHQAQVVREAEVQRKIAEMKAKT